MQRDIVDHITRLKQERNAIILAHNYQRPEVQDIADHVGDSLELARMSQSIAQETIVLCGVLFMAEITKILNPEKTVLMPDTHAGCPMANMIAPPQLVAAKAEHPGAAVICYVNSTAEIKALSDICCTSANGLKVARARPEREIIFIPDQYLGAYVSRQLPEKKFHLWPGYCPTHMVFSPEELLRLKELHPGARIVCHPECRLEIHAIADRICSTSQMIEYARENEAKQFIICTERAMLHRLQKENPTKEFIPGSPNAICPNMKVTTLERVLWSLERMESRVEIDEPVRLKARSAIERMLRL